MRIVPVLALFVTLVTGCTQPADKPADIYLGGPAMDLPAGYRVTYTARSEQRGEYPVTSEPREIDCLLIRSTAPQTADYCGYLIHASEDGFSFDTIPRPAASFQYGELVYTVSGAGDADGAEIYDRYDQVGGDWWMTVDYVVTHLEEL